MFDDNPHLSRRTIIIGTLGLLMCVQCLLVSLLFPDQIRSLPDDLRALPTTIKSAERGCPPLPGPRPAAEQPALPGRIAVRASCSYGGQVDLFLLERDGSVRNLTFSTNDELEFSWSPDGTRIAMASDRAGNFDVWVIDVDSGVLTQLTHHPADDRQPSWSPDGKTIAFLSFRDAPPEDERGEIYVMALDGSNERRLTNNQVDRAGQKWIPWLNGEEHDLCVWSPDSQHFATNIKGGTTIFALDGSPPRTIFPQSPTPRRRDGEPSSDRVVDWSSDGTHLLLYSNRGGMPTDDWTMYVLDLETEQLTRLVRQVGMQPRFSPDGQRILFTDKWNGGDDVFLIDPDGSNKVDITGNGCNAMNVRWSPDGSHISYATLCGGFRLMVMQADGTESVGFFSMQDWQTHHHEWGPQP